MNVASWFEFTAANARLQGLSTHMAILQNAGLVRSRREGRSIIFVAVPARFAAAQSFLAQGVSTPKGKAKATLS